MIVFIINNIFEVSLALTILIIKISWIIDKLKVKKEILEMKKLINIILINQEKLRTTNHKIVNIVNGLNIRQIVIEENEQDENFNSLK